jgi:hypothetical protein
MKNIVTDLLSALLSSGWRMITKEETEPQKGRVILLRCSGLTALRREQFNGLLSALLSNGSVNKPQQRDCFYVVRDTTVATERRSKQMQLCSN